MTFPASIFIDSRRYDEPKPVVIPKRVWRVPDKGRYAITLHDYERIDRYIDSKFYSNGYVTYNLRKENVPLPIHEDFKKNPPESAYPETVRMWGERPTDYVPLSKDWQWFWYHLMEEACQHTLNKIEMKNAWFSMTQHGRAFTDRHTRNQGFTDHVLGVNLNSPQGDMQHMSITCGGNLVKILGEQSGYYVVEAFNLMQPPPDPSIAIEQNWLSHWATQCTVLKLPDGRWKVMDFPQLRPFGSPFLMVSRTGTNLILKSHVREVKNSTVYSPYVGQYGF